MNPASSTRIKRFSPAVAMVTLAAATIGLTGQADATSNPRGSACGYRTNLSLSGGPYGSQGCPTQTSPYASLNSLSPSVTLPAGGTTGAISAVDSNGAQAWYGAWDMFGGPSPSDPTLLEPPSGSLSVNTKGTTVVTSTATVKSVGLLGHQGAARNRHQTQFKATSVKGNCTAHTSSHTWSTTLVDSAIVTSTDADGLPLTTFSVPGTWVPPVNYTVHGEVNNLGDNFDIVLNEHITNPGGTFTVNAVHMYLNGPFEVGDIVVGQAMCGM